MDKTQQAVDVFNKRADVYQDKYMDVHLYHTTLDLLLNNITRQNAAVLDIACGPGNITQYLLNKRTDLNILGIDLAPDMLRLARINNPTAEFQLMDCRDISKLEKQYDAIIIGFCLPYLSKEEAINLIHDAATMLNKGGILYISTMEDDYSKSRMQTSSSGDQLFMHFHQADYLTEAITESHLHIIDLRHQPYPTTDGTKTTDLIIIAVN